MSTTRREQRERTRQHLLDTTVRCLVEYGYSGTTTHRVQERAQVSRGALLHHFASRAELFAAAIRYIAGEQLERFRAAVAGADSLRHLVTELRRAMSGPLFLAGLELWMTARTDPVLRAALLPAERRLGRELRQAYFAVVKRDDAESRTAFEALLMLLRGLALTSVLRENPEVADAVVEQWLTRMAPEQSA
ncbi:TetR/AcrR family transcriptional regulator [Amycolatopsis rhizosphaerae]|uniref:TetR/AcrR family transcriptional regulator n=1 Tax=Amycolatopsis rhizosphaerae TaxID=2053003 RepID=A0A558DIN2_9PSEU|nr:TetR/AcrR family transcriptional regulator [Amycolatopsis rhizosphaerae]TVT60850.1 TetR/AcrR family transcriptional regulator [Amycolatopsis rhizosphaerae]